jgi:hypothetical protein
MQEVGKITPESRGKVRNANGMFRGSARLVMGREDGLATLAQRHKLCSLNKNRNNCYTSQQRGLGSSVDIATGYGLDGPGIEFLL